MREEVARDYRCDWIEILEERSFCLGHILYSPYFREPQTCKTFLCIRASTDFRTCDDEWSKVEL